MRALAAALGLVLTVSVVAPALGQVQVVLPRATERLEIAGQACPELRRTPVRDWFTVIYFDPAMLTPDGMRRAALALADEADRLAARGPVEVVLVDPYPTPYLDATGDAAALREGLEILAEESVLAGERVEIRDERAALGDGDSALHQQLAGEEQALWRRSRSALLDYLAISAARGPRALLLIEDGFPTPAAEQQIAAHWARSLAAGGWSTQAVALGEVPTALAPSTADLEALAAESGGSVATTAADLEAWLTASTDYDLVTCDLASEDGRPVTVGAVPLAGSPRWTTAGSPRSVSERRARQALEGSLRGAGRGETRLLLSGALRVDREQRSASASDRLEVSLLWSNAAPEREESEALRPGAATTARLTLVAERLDAEPFVLHEVHAIAERSVGTDWLFQRTLSVSEDVRVVAVVLEDLTSGAWGALKLPFVNSPFAAPVGRSVITAGEPLGSGTLQPPTAAAGGAAGTAPTAAASATATESDIADRVIVLLPPRRAGAGRFSGAVSGAIKGRIRLETLATSDAIGRAVFYLDDREVGRDEKAPFSTVVDLGDEAVPMTLKVVAETVGGRPLAEHAIEINRGARPFRVRFAALEGEPAAGSVRVTAEVQVPPRRQLARAELYRNLELIETFPAAELQDGTLAAEVATPQVRPEDYLRVVAYLDDGQFLEDVVLLSAPALSDRVDVNLVEIYAVVSDRDGTPVQGLSAADFAVERKGETLTIDRFQVADEVPLIIGLLIDTSESMWGLMPDTKKAAARFLTETLAPSDGAFLVSFDDRPRLVHGVSQDVFDLLRSFAVLNPGGSTALYDSIVFSLAQIEGNAGRRALVLLTDGQDAGSRFGHRRAIELARKQGVPIYILSLAGLGSASLGGRPVRPFHYSDLEAVTARTGGRLFDIDRIEQLGEAYAQINAELRNQYILGLNTEKPLSAEELGEIEVAVEGRGRRVRAAIGSSDR
ncbi:MAG: VWA domain-containing protein [Acidobacteriota bacterium]